MDTSIQNTSWDSLPWSKFQIKLFRLQSRIYKAMQSGEVKKTIKLQKILLENKSVHFLAVQRITQLNKYDVISSQNNFDLTNDEKMDLVVSIGQNLNNWYHSPLQNICITKRGLKKQITNFSNFEDLVVQCIWKYALEPTYLHRWPIYYDESNIIVSNYASTMQKKILLNLTSKHTKIIKIVVNNFWDSSKYQILISRLVFPLKYKTGLIRALRVGILDDIGSALRSANSIIGRLLVNILLDSLENLDYNFDKNIIANDKNKSFLSFRHENHIIYMLNSDDNPNKFLKRIHTILHKNGLNLIDNSITESTDGFDFLSWHFVLKNDGTATSYPSNTNWLIYKNKIKFIFKNSQYNIPARIEQIKFIVKQWYQYHRHCEISQMNSQIYSLKHWCRWYMRNNTKIDRSEINCLIKAIFNYTSVILLSVSLSQYC
nr:reverse transcriptase [Rhodomonas sp. NIES-2332]